MAELEPWYRVTRPQEEVREGRPFNPDKFAIHLDIANEAYQRIPVGRRTEAWKLEKPVASRKAVR